MTRCLLACFAALGVVLGLAGGAQAAKRGGTLRIGLHGNVGHLDPLTEFGPIAKVVRELLGSSLVLVDENFQIVGDLARKWEVSEDGRNVTFHLHPGAKFHDGTDLDAEAVKWNIEMINGRLETAWMKEAKKANPQFRFNTMFALYLNQVQRAEVVDKHTVRFHLAEMGKSMTLPALAGYYTRMVLVSPKAYDGDIGGFKKHPVLGGPFRFVEWKPNRHIILERFPQYFLKDRPYLDRIELYYMPDANQRISALRTGEIDFTLLVPFSLFSSLKGAPGIVIHSSKADTVFSLPINIQRPAWKDIRVRQALVCHGIDRALIAQTVMRGLSGPWVSFAPPAAKDALDLTGECPYDPRRAQQLLAEAGHGPDNPLKFTITIGNFDPAHAEAAQSLKAMYSKLGVETRIEILDRATWNRTFIIRRTTDMTILDTVPLFDVNAGTHAVYSKSPFDYYNIKDSKLDSMIEAWRSTIDPRKQLEVSHQIQRYLVERAYYPAVTGSPLVQAHRDYVKGFRFLGRLANDFREVWLDK